MYVIIAQYFDNWGSVITDTLYYAKTIRGATRKKYQLLNYHKKRYNIMETKYYPACNLAFSNSKTGDVDYTEEMKKLKKKFKYKEKYVFKNCAVKIKRLKEAK